MNNASELIKNDCLLVDFSGQKIDFTEIQNRKRFLKIQMHQTLNANTRDKTVYVGINDFDWVVPIMLAVWELGSNLFVHDLNAGFTQIPEFKDFYNFIDLSILHPTASRSVNTFNTPSINLRNYNNANQYEDSDCIEISTSTVAIKTHTSGTTGRPKIVDFTHRHLIDRTREIASFHRYNDKDRPFHFKTFHHGALFIDYALPLLSVATEHYFIRTMTSATSGKNYNAKNYLNLVLPYIQKYKLTTIIIPYEWVNYFDQTTPVDMGGQLSIRTLRGYDANICSWIFENINPKEIVNQFGCSEIGTMFISRVTHDNYKNYIHNLFTERAPGLEYMLEKNLVHARRTGYEWHVLADEFIEDGDRLYYQGRSYSFIIDNEPVYIQELENYLRTLYYPTKFQLVPDFASNNIYLALFDLTLDTDVAKINELIANNVSPKHCVKGVKYFNLPDVVLGIKPSGQILLYAFTKDQNDIQ
jgi:hypothetical protein